MGFEDDTVCLLDSEAARSLLFCLVGCCTMIHIVAVSWRQDDNLTDLIVIVKSETGVMSHEQRSLK